MLEPTRNVLEDLDGVFTRGRESMAGVQPGCNSQDYDDKRIPEHGHKEKPSGCWVAGREYIERQREDGGPYLSQGTDERV